MSFERREHERRELPPTFYGRRKKERREVWFRDNRHRFTFPLWMALGLFCLLGVIVAVLS